MILVLANLFGLISGLTYWVSNLKKTKRERVKLHLICNISDFLQYVCTNSTSGIIDVIIAWLKNVLFLFVRKEKVRNLLVYIVSFIKIILLIIVHENLIILFKILIEVFKVGALCKGKVKHTLHISIVDSFIWMLYDFDAGAYAAAILGIGSVASLILGLVKNKGKLDGNE